MVGIAHMAWIESHQEIREHPKTRRLARRLGITVPAAIGHLHLLWWWSVDYAEDGNLAKYMPEDIADAVMWDGDPQALWDALVELHWIDVKEDGPEVHDWDTYIGRLLEKRRKDAERKRDSRDKTPPVQPPSAGHPSDASEDIHATAQVTVPYRTVPSSPAEKPPARMSIVRQSEPKTNRSGDVIDAIRASGIEPMLVPRDHTAIRTAGMSAELIAELYGAIYRGEYGDEFMQRNLSVHMVIEKIPGYLAFKANGPPKQLLGSRNGLAVPPPPPHMKDNTGVRH